MRRLIAGMAAVVLIGGTLVLGFALATASPGGCPTALLEGTLVEDQGTLAVAAASDGTLVDVAWPFGYGVERRDGTLTLTRVFLPVAREGDPVSIGGGGGAPGFRACGPITVGRAVPVEDTVPATLTVTGTALEPCIPPPSGCGYWVVIASSGNAVRAPLEHHRTIESAANGAPAPLTVGEGLPATLVAGIYELRFEVGEYSDADPAGTSPRIGVACTQRLDVSAAVTRVEVNVTYDGALCSVEVTETEALR